jgi:RNase P subunit RPR2
MKFLFCPNCHQRVIPPKWIMNANIKSEKGVTLECGACKKGKVKFKPPVKEEVEHGEVLDR